MNKPAVEIRRIDSYDLPVIEEAVADFFKEIKSPKINHSKRVLIKPNALGAYPPERAVTTHPIVLEAIIRYFLDRKKEIWFGDSPGNSVAFETVWQTCGFSSLAEKYHLKVVNFSTLGFRELSYKDISIKVSEALFQCGIIINVGKYKTHQLTAFTGALKNLFGFVPGLAKSEYHRLYPDTNSFAAMLTALYAVIGNRITYSIIDGITGMDGNGPSAGKPHHFGLLFGSTSIPALDYVASRIMGFQLKDVPYLSSALIMDGILPSQIKIPVSFRNYRIPDADINSVKVIQKTLKYVPGIARKAFRKVYYFYPAVSERCKQCGICVKSCPVKAISWQNNTKPYIHKEQCIKCLCCHELCPYQAIDIKKSLLARLGV